HRPQIRRDYVQSPIRHECNGSKKVAGAPDEGSHSRSLVNRIEASCSATLIGGRTNTAQRSGAWLESEVGDRDPSAPGNRDGHARHDRPGRGIQLIQIAAGSWSRWRRKSAPSERGREKQAVQIEYQSRKPRNTRGLPDRSYRSSALIDPYQPSLVDAA